MVKKKAEKEFVKIVKANEKGLDYLHFSLMFLIIVLIALVFFLASNQKINIQQQALHSKEEIINFSSRIIASYLNSNYSFIPFSSSLPNASFFNGTWIVEANVSKDKLIIVIDDENLSIKNVYFATSIPKVSLANLKIVANGVIELNYPKCNETFWFIDPYSINALTTLNYSNYSNPQTKFVFIFTKDSLMNYPTYGINRTQMLTRYLYCAYKQGKLIRFIDSLKSLGIVVSPRAFPVYEEVLKSASSLASLNLSQLDSCLDSSTQALNAQATLANFYNITFSPAVLVDCKYLTIPQHVSDALAYIEKQK